MSCGRAIRASPGASSRTRPRARCDSRCAEKRTIPLEMDTDDRTSHAAWRQPSPLPAGEIPRADSPSGLRARATRLLADVFEASEDENKRVILRLVASATPRQRVLDL